MAKAIRVNEKVVKVEPLTSEAFAPFGTVIENPLGDLAPTAPLPAQLPHNAVQANQQTAVKFRNVTSLTNYYDRAASKQPAATSVSMFACKPRPLQRQGSMTPVASCPVNYDAVFRSSGRDAVEVRLDVKVLERHPFTSQTFVPMGLDGSDPGTCYIVVVAPTLPHEPPPRGFSWRNLFPYPSSESLAEGPKGSGPPSFEGLRAFLAQGSQAVTYGAGTWHAPMIVVGQRSVNFAVFQFSNGVDTEDCQELELTPVDERHGGISIQLSVPRDDVGRRSNVRSKL